MGQQQLLLVTMVTIIVAIATIVAINILSHRAEQSNRDAVRQDLIQAATYLQSIWERPGVMGGANRDFTSLNKNLILRFINVPSSSFVDGDTEAVNSNGVYRIGEVNELDMIIIGEPESGPPNLQIFVYRNPETGNWNFEVSENSDDDS
jgi:hypothetical protein